MKKINILLLLALFTLSNYANAAIIPANINTKTSDETRTVSNFTGIASGGPLTIKVTMGDKESIRLEGDQNAIADLLTEVKDGTLTIKPKTKWNEWSRRYSRPAITIYVSAKRLNSIVMSGSGSITVENPINSSDLSATLSGSGSISAVTNAKSLTAVISGSGAISLSGKTENSSITLSGSGSFLGKSLSSDNSSVQISGSAVAYLKANNSLSVVISGSGSLSYTGNATVNKTIIGSGSVRKI